MNIRDGMLTLQNELCSKISAFEKNTEMMVHNIGMIRHNQTGNLTGVRLIVSPVEKVERQITLARGG